MADSGVMQGSQKDGELGEGRSVGEEPSGLEVLPAESGRSVISPGAKESSTFLALGESGVCNSPPFRRSSRKKSLRSPASRGLLKHSMPKSPLMRMAEMRKSRLRGRVLRNPDLKGLEMSESRTRKGRKGFGRRRLAPISEVPVIDEGEKEEGSGLGAISGCEDLVGAGAEMGEAGNEVVLSSSDNGTQLEWLPEGVNSDLALDLIEAQPLQEMLFVGKQPIATKDSLMEELVLGEEEKANDSDTGFSLGADEEFPPLSKEGLKKDKDKERKSGGEGRNENGKGAGQFVREKLEKKKGLMAART